MDMAIHVHVASRVTEQPSETKTSWGLMELFEQTATEQPLQSHSTATETVTKQPGYVPPCFPGVPVVVLPGSGCHHLSNIPGNGRPAP